MKELVKGFLVQNYETGEEQHYLLHPTKGAFKAVNRVTMPYDSFNLKSWKKIDSIPSEAVFCGNYYNPIQKVS